MYNHLNDQTSPYLLQHADNPVHWYPWCEEAFEKAKKEEKPIFLSIGYSTCHWCHVMAHESFEDIEIASILNENFVSIKVDKEERPDIDSIYMSVCQSLTGSSGWPTTIFMTPEQKPFFAGTYFSKNTRLGSIGFQELIKAIADKWKHERNALLESANQVLSILKKEEPSKKNTVCSPEKIIETALFIYHKSFDKINGGFGQAPKFPSPHNLLFLMHYYEKTNHGLAMEMVDKTLLQMYRGGIFDHIGGGFSRYSTDDYFLAPHFEKMLYDNALLILAYAKAYELSQNKLYLDIAKQTADYVLNEMTSPDGGFYSAQDADSEGIEGKYYLFEPAEIINVLGQENGQEFCNHYDITEKGNFEGKNIPNLLQTNDFTADYHTLLPNLYDYRKNRYHLHLDDKILTSWNGLMIAAMCHLYRVTQNSKYINAAKQAQSFIENNLWEENSLFVSWRDNRRSGNGFLDDYANEIFALLSLYESTFDKRYLSHAKTLCDRCISLFYDKDASGFFLNGSENEELIMRTKETYDGAMPSGNSMMAYNLLRLSHYYENIDYDAHARQQLQFMITEAVHYPSGYAMFLCALLDYVELPTKVTIVLKDKTELEKLKGTVPLSTIVKILDEATLEYPLINEQTTYYVCKGRSCQPPTNNSPF